MSSAKIVYIEIRRVFSLHGFWKRTLARKLDAVQRKTVIRRRMIPRVCLHLLRLHFLGEEKSVRRLVIESAIERALVEIGRSADRRRVLVSSVALMVSRKNTCFDGIQRR